MSYQVLARKWRPRTFADLVGQEHVRQALENSLCSGRLHHAYLFTGTRGVGKTTVARIMAKALCCESGISAEPCGVCAACTEIDDGRFLDLLEIDAASRTKVDDTRDLLENVQYAPTRGRFKIYLIDEVHMFSRSSFNALLKTLEEPPPHVKFLLATTDPQKIPVTILSRCLQFNLRQMTVDVVEAQLQKVAVAESVEYEQQALRLLARGAAGSMRDGLSLLDQAIAYAGGPIAVADVAKMLGTINHEQVVEIVQALHRGDANALLSLVEVISARVPDYAAILEELLSLLHALSVRQQVEDAPVQVEVSDSQLAELAAAIPAEQLQLYYQLGLHGRRDLPLAPTPRIGLEMALLRMLAFQPQRTALEIGFQSKVSEMADIAGGVAGEDPGAQTGAREGQISARITDPNPTAATEHAQGLSTAVEQKRGNRQPQALQPETGAEIPPTPVAENDLAMGFGIAEASDSETERQREPKSPLVDPASHHPEPDPPPVHTVSEPQQATASSVDLPDWSQLAYDLSLTGLAQQLAAQLSLVAIDSGVYHFKLASAHRAVLNLPAQRRLEDALSARAGEAIKAEIELVDLAAETPARKREREQQEKLDEVTRNLQQDPNVKALEGAFGARLDEQSIQVTGAHDS